MFASKRWNAFICVMLVVITVISCMCTAATATTLDIEIPEDQNWTKSYNAGRIKVDMTQLRRNVFLSTRKEVV